MGLFKGAVRTFFLTRQPEGEKPRLLRGNKKRI
jgi:hypothetical protein